jgi:UDP:flavonoid glycosyltransferase YjiC (YdhE family)
MRTEGFMRILLVTAGSAGNTLPFVGLGAALRARGHDVTLIASGAGTDTARRNGLGFVELDDPEVRAAASADTANVRDRAFLRSLGPHAVRHMKRVYRLIAERHVPGETVVVSQPWLFGARIAQEKLGVPLATVHLQPVLFGSALDRSGRSRWVPRWAVRVMNAVVERAVDWGLAGAIDSFREELGLRAGCRPVLRWWRSPELVIGFFPAWFTAPQPDWPPHTVLGGFPLSDTPGTAPAELEDFLDAGEPPLVFSQAWLVKDAHPYFETAVEIAQRLGQRAVLLTPHPQQLPAALPAGVRHFGFVPLSALLPRSAAVIHHGGMGTLGHALAAGLPQVTVPVALDQFDNSRRLHRLGVSVNLRAAEYRPERVARLVRGLLESREVAQRCRLFAALQRAERSFEKACLAIEQLHERCPVVRSGV